VRRKPGHWGRFTAAPGAPLPCPGVWWDLRIEKGDVLDVDLHLDGPCGWIFVPFLAGKERKSEARGGYFCFDDLSLTLRVSSRN
jgi:hypothetical protein